MKTRFILALIVLVSSCAQPVPDIKKSSKAMASSEDVVLSEFFSTNTCADQPSSARLFASRPFYWRGSEMMMVTEGNEAWIYSLEKDGPTKIASSRFNVPNVGDSDWDLQNVIVCDDCRFGLASYKAGTVLFDMGTGLTPGFTDFEYKPGIGQNSSGGFAYSDQYGTEYLVASGLTYDCGSKSALYRFGGIDAYDVVQCIDIPGRITTITNGAMLNEYVYLIDSAKRVSIFKDLTQFGGIGLEFVSIPFSSYGVKAIGFSFDLERNVLANEGIIYDISDRSSPEVLFDTGYHDVNRSAMKWPIVFFGRKGFKNSEMTFDISNPLSPVMVHEQFWEPDNPWNYPGAGCAKFQDVSTWNTKPYILLARDGKAQFASIEGWLPEEGSSIFSDGFETGNVSRWEENL